MGPVEHLPEGGVGQGLLRDLEVQSVVFDVLLDRDVAVAVLIHCLGGLVVVGPLPRHGGHQVGATAVELGRRGPYPSVLWASDTSPTARRAPAAAAPQRCQRAGAAVPTPAALARAGRRARRPRGPGLGAGLGAGLGRRLSSRREHHGVAKGPVSAVRADDSRRRRGYRCCQSSAPRRCGRNNNNNNTDSHETSHEITSHQNVDAKEEPCGHL